jgi:hypothetical protein
VEKRFHPKGGNMPRSGALRSHGRAIAHQYRRFHVLSRARALLDFSFAAKRSAAGPSVVSMLTPPRNLATMRRNLRKSRGGLDRGFGGKTGFGARRK